MTKGRDVQGGSIKFPASMAAAFLLIIGLIAIIAGAIIMITPEEEISTPFLKGLGVAVGGGFLVSTGIAIQYVFDMRNLMKWRHEQYDA